MPDISSIGSNSFGPLSRGAQPTENGSLRAVNHQLPKQANDRVEVSDHARFLDQLRRGPDIRQGRIDQIKQAISQDTYLTPQRLNVAMELLIEDVTNEL